MSGSRRKKNEFLFLTTSLLVLAFSLFLVPNFIPFGRGTDNYYHVFLNGEEVGTVSDEAEAEEDLVRARREIAATSGEMIFVDADLEVTGEEVFWGRTDAQDDIVAAMREVLSRHELLTLQHCYTLRIGNYIFNMASVEDIRSMLNSVLEQYDPERQYIVSVKADTGREVSALTYEVLTTSDRQRQEAQQTALPSAGIEQTFTSLFDDVTPVVGKDFEDYTLGLQSIDFGEQVEISETYLPASQVRTLADAQADVLGDVSKDASYEVQSGDTLNAIAAAYGLTAGDLVSLNGLSGTDAIIRPGDILTVRSSSPKLTVVYTNQEYYEEDYDADVIYKENDDWYNTEQEVIQEASQGHRRVIALVSYEDDVVTGTDIVKQETTKDAVPEIIEIGTKERPVYIWPAYGTISSGFGSRARPKAGASTYHQGIDIAVSSGTSVEATRGGTVTAAGWQSGYGYVVYIDHGGGISSRYGHLSRILVRVGQTVSQGEVIARSGNTGNSTGPHLHFEIRINGTAVNPLGYLN